MGLIVNRKHKESMMPITGWKKLVASMPASWKKGEAFIPAYSENMPAPHIGVKPYRQRLTDFFLEKHPFGWPVDEWEYSQQIIPGMSQIARQIQTGMVALGQGKASQGITKTKLMNNPAWPMSLAEAAAAGRLAHEKYVCFSPLALSKTQDDKARVRWTFFGGSDHGPGTSFWKPFTEKRFNQKYFESFFKRLLERIYNEVNSGKLINLGFRIYPGKQDGLLPEWSKQYEWNPRDDIGKLRYLFTFVPFARLPKYMQSKYLIGELVLLPFPGSLIFWGIPQYDRLAKSLRWARQIPLSQLVDRHESINGFRVPQGGWFHEPKPHEQRQQHGDHGKFKNILKVGHRWERMHRHDIQQPANPYEGPVSKTLFSENPTDTGLYRKPLARNVQIWSNDYEPILDGPRSTLDQIQKAGNQINQGGQFGFRMFWNPMRVGKYEVFWHLPVIQYRTESGNCAVFDSDHMLGFFSAHRQDKPTKTAAEFLFPVKETHRHHAVQAVSGTQSQVSFEAIKLKQSAHRFPSRKVPLSFGHSLLRLKASESMEHWVEQFCKYSQKHLGKWSLSEIRSAIGKDETNLNPLTYDYTANRKFEEKYWENIQFLSTGTFHNKCVADCMQDGASQKALKVHHNDLAALGDYLLLTHRITAAKLNMEEEVHIGFTPFHWKTLYPYPFYQGWKESQINPCERNLVVVIPGKDRTKAVILADHYDTAYMEDHYGYRQEAISTGARISSQGADDNHSATAALIMAGETLMKLSKAGKLGCDVWLVHLTGEEFPSDCMGARYLAQQLIENRMKVKLFGYYEGKTLDLSSTQVKGLYVMDMIAHNNDHEPDIFQISPGYSRDSLWLAYQAHLANRLWNESVTGWNKIQKRTGLPRGLRVKEGETTTPVIAPYLPLNGEVRLPNDPRSSLFNTDGQIFSDSGIPCVLFMENYDINRTGYHDRFDTLANIDLDYGSAVAAIAIESVARAANVKTWRK